MTARGWSSGGLKTIGDDDTLWTVAEAAVLLGPPRLSVTQVRRMTRRRKMQPVGKRRTSSPGKAGRYARVYRAKDLIEAYDSLAD